MKLANSLQKHPYISQWLKFNSDLKLEVKTGKVELGQKLTTSLAMIAAEELDLNINQVVVNFANTNESPDEQFTVGSNSIEESGLAIQQVSAFTRKYFLDLASKRLNLNFEDLYVKNGVVMSFNSPSQISYWNLAKGKSLYIKIDEIPKTKEPSNYNIVGKNSKDLLIKKIVKGKLIFVQDLDFKDMLYGAILRPSGYKSQLTQTIIEKAKLFDGIVELKIDGNFIGVVAETERQAFKAIELIRANSSWSKNKININSKNIYTKLKSNKNQSYYVKDGSAINHPIDLNDYNLKHSIQSIYLRPYQMHASIGPSAAVAKYENGKYFVWTNSQGIYPLKIALSEAIGTPKNNIKIYHIPGPGSYGHNGADDAAFDACLLARKVEGKHVKVQWKREDENLWEPYGPAMRMELSATLEKDGKIKNWSHQTYSDAHSARPRFKEGHSNLLASWDLKKPLPPLPKQKMFGFHGGVHRNADPIYNIPNKTIIKTTVDDLPLRVSALRTLGAYANVFAIESFMDELACFSNQDPIAFRLKHLDNKRARSVIEKAAEISNWNYKTDYNGSGKGIGFAQYKNIKCFAAVIVDLEVDDFGNIKLKEATIVADAGKIIDPKGLISQLEGGFIQSASWTMLEEVKFDENEIYSTDWDKYPILSFKDIPKIETFLIDRPYELSLGSGEATQGPTAGAIGNAIFNAIGVRAKKIPFTIENIREAAADN